MLRAAPFVLTFLLISLSLPQAVRAEADNTLPGWLELGTDEGITVFRKEMPDNPIYAYRGTGVLDVPVGKIISVSRDVARQPEWVNRLEVARILREFTPFHRIIYLKVNTPWPVSDRDFVIDSQLVVDPIKKTAVFDIHSVEDPLMPVDDCCVRGQVHRNHIELQSTEGNKTLINAEAHVDPKGSLPKWLVNKIQKTFPRKSINGLLMQVKKPDIKDFFTEKH